LVLNLENETYLQLVLGGSLEALPAKLAEASREAGSFDAWRRQRGPRLLGELPRRLLREEDFIDHFLEAYVHSCQTSAPRAAQPHNSPKHLLCQPNFGTIGFVPVEARFGNYRSRTGVGRDFRFYPGNFRTVAISPDDV
jgi:hypothetical protein